MRVLLTATFALGLFLGRTPASGEVVFTPVPAGEAFPGAIEPDALRYACAATSEELAAFFTRKSLRFSPELLREKAGHAACHIHYEPTVHGYRALPDDQPITGLFVSVDPSSFVAGRPAQGDSLSIAKQALQSIGRPLDVTISVAGSFDPKRWPESLASHFGESIHRFTLRPSGADSAHPWAQDYLKAGQVGGRLRILTPRRLFEGRREDGDAFDSMLDTFDAPVYARSKLSWEGGDIQFVRLPRNPAKLLIVHGGAGRRYWGSNLDAAEVSYVLLTEFGADSAVDLTPATLHADYVVAFLPEERTALVSQSVGSGHPALFLAAADAFANLFPRNPPPALLDLRRYLASWDGDLSANAGPLRGLIGGLERALQSYAYPKGPAPERELFTLAAARMLGLMRSQLPRKPAPRELALESAALKFEQLGFRVVRAPYLYAPSLSGAWTGVAYVNSLIDGRNIFMPALGLGKLEQAIFADLQQRIGGGYQIIPVDAREALLNNGGAHCVFGVIRTPSPSRSPSD